MRKIHIIPMLNPDGVEYRLNGISENNPIRERVIAYNEGEDFTKWNANARGVDLNHNYNARFNEYKIYEKQHGITPGKTKYSGEYPESEPETAALCAFVRSMEISLVMSLHSQGEEIYYSYIGDDESSRRNLSAAKKLSELCGYKLSEPQGMASYGGLSDWCGSVGIPSFTFECGIGKNPLPISECRSIYAKMRAALFCAPNLF